MDSPTGKAFHLELLAGANTDYIRINLSSIQRISQYPYTWHPIKKKYWLPIVQNRKVFQTLKKFTVRPKLTRTAPSSQIKARPGPGPTNMKCRFRPSRINLQQLSLGPSWPGSKGFKEKSVRTRPATGSGSGQNPAPSSPCSSGWGSGEIRLSESHQSRHRRHRIHNLATVRLTI